MLGKEFDLEGYLSYRKFPAGEAWVQVLVPASWCVSLDKSLNTDRLQLLACASLMGPR